MTASLLARWTAAAEAELLAVLDVAPGEAADRVLLARGGRAVGWAVAGRGGGGAPFLHRAADLAAALACDGLAAVLRRPAPELPRGVIVATVVAGGWATTRLEWVRPERAEDGTLRAVSAPLPEGWRGRVERQVTPALQRAVARAGRDPDHRLAELLARAMRRRITLVVNEAADRAAS